MSFAECDILEVFNNGFALEDLCSTLKLKLACMVWYCWGIAAGWGFGI